ncbi:unnamed protein product, partial [Heterosigma akashiwo]
YLEDGSKVRIAKRSGSIIPRPDILMERRTPRSTVVGEKDTVPEEAPGGHQRGWTRRQGATPRWPPTPRVCGPPPSP